MNYRDMTVTELTNDIDVVMHEVDKVKTNGKCENGPEHERLSAKLLELHQAGVSWHYERRILGFHTR